MKKLIELTKELLDRFSIEPDNAYIIVQDKSGEELYVEIDPDIADLVLSIESILHNGEIGDINDEDV